MRFRPTALLQLFLREEQPGMAMVLSKGEAHRLPWQGRNPGLTISQKTKPVNNSAITD